MMVHAQQMATSARNGAGVVVPMVFRLQWLIEWQLRNDLAATIVPRITHTDIDGVVNSLVLHARYLDMVIETEVNAYRNCEAVLESIPQSSLSAIEDRM